MIARFKEGSVRLLPGRSCTSGAGCFYLSHGGHFLDTCLLANVWNSVASYGLQSQVQDRE